MCKMVVKITKVPWEKCGIENICYYDEENKVRIVVENG